MLSLVSFIVLVGVLITAHEAGHFIVAKLSGVKVVTFSVGFGPAMFKRKIGETEYQVAWLPLGGYVRMLGHFPEDHEPGDEGRSLLDKPPSIRILIAAAGPAMNLLLPFLILIPAVALSGSYAEVYDSQVGAVDMSLPAGRQGLREGDRIVAIDGDEVSTFWQVARRVDEYDADQGPLKLTVERAGSAGEATREALEVRPEAIEENLLGFTTTKHRIGIQPVFLRADVAVTDPDGPLGRAGVRTFDRIEKVGAVETPRYVDAERALRAIAPGARVPLALSRDSEVDERFPFIRKRQPLEVTYVGPEDHDPGMRHAGACVTSVAPDGPTAGSLHRGDCVVAVEGDEHTLGLFVHTRLTSRPELPRRLTVLRDGVRHEVLLTQREVKRDDPFHGEVKAWEAGFTLLDAPGGRLRPDGVMDASRVANPDRLGHAWYEANRRVWQTVDITVRTLAGILVGKVSTSQLSGPLTIAHLAGEQARRGLQAFLYLMVLLSLNLALFNLLPIPVLDGGQIMVAFAELVMRRPLPERVLHGLQVVGVLLVVALMVLALGNDAIRTWRLSNPS